MFVWLQGCTVANPLPSARVIVRLTDTPTTPGGTVSGTCRATLAARAVLLRVSSTRVGATPTNLAPFANAEAAPLGPVNRLLPARMRPNDVPRMPCRNFVMAAA